MGRVGGRGLVGSSPATFEGLARPMPRPVAAASCPGSPASSMVMPASSLILRNLKRSRRLPVLDRLALIVSSSSILPSSWLLPIVAREVLVFLLSAVGSGGDPGCFLLELFRESHEKGLVSFRVGAAGGGGSEVCFSEAGGGGGGGNWTGDILPDRPCRPLAESRDGSLGAPEGSGLLAASEYCQFTNSGRICMQYSRRIGGAKGGFKGGMSRDALECMVVQRARLFCKAQALHREQIYLLQARHRPWMSQISYVT